MGARAVCTAPHRWRQLKPQVPPRLLRLTPRREYRREAVRARAAAATRTAAARTALHSPTVLHTALHTAHLFEAPAIGEEGVEHRLRRCVSGRVSVSILTVGPVGLLLLLLLFLFLLLLLLLLADALLLLGERRFELCEYVHAQCRGGGHAQRTAQPDDTLVAQRRHRAVGVRARQRRRAAQQRLLQLRTGCRLLRRFLLAAAAAVFLVKGPGQG